MCLRPFAVVVIVSRHTKILITHDIVCLIIVIRSAREEGVLNCTVKQPNEGGEVGESKAKATCDRGTHEMCEFLKVTGVN